MRKTKIVSTLGPKTRDCDQIRKIIMAGADAIRINFHMIIMRFMVKQ